MAVEQEPEMLLAEGLVGEQEPEMLLVEGLVGELEPELESVAIGDRKEPTGTMKMVFG